MYIFSSGTLKLVSNGNTRAHFFSFPLSFPLLRGKKKREQEDTKIMSGEGTPFPKAIF